MNPSSRNPLAWHFAHAAPFPLRPLEKRKDCIRLWRDLLSHFPEAIAVCLMMDHLHILLPFGKITEEEYRRRLSRILPAEWRKTPLSPAQAIPNTKHLLRQIRYVHLNPCRDALTNDPLQWEWSTHAAWLGLSLPSFPSIPRWRDRLGFQGATGLENFHRYISSDPTVHPLGSPLPPTRPQEMSLAAIDLEAASRAYARLLRLDLADVLSKGRRRTHFISVLTELLHVPPIQVARFLNVSSQTVWKARSSPKIFDSSLKPLLQKALIDQRLRTLTGS